MTWTDLVGLLAKEIGNRVHPIALLYIPFMRRAQAFAPFGLRANDCAGTQWANAAKPPSTPSHRRAFTRLP